MQHLWAPFLYITTPPPQTCCAGVMCERANANRLFTGVRRIVRAHEPDGPVNVKSHYFTLCISNDGDVFVNMHLLLFQIRWEPSDDAQVLSAVGLHGHHPALTRSVQVQTHTSYAHYRKTLLDGYHGTWRRDAVRVRDRGGQSTHTLYSSRNKNTTQVKGLSQPLYSNIKFSKS